MEVHYYPGGKNVKTDGSTVKEKIGKLTKKKPALWTLFDTTIQEVRKNGLEAYRKIEVVLSIKHREITLQEFRIPKTRRGGVLRVYFCDYPNDSNSILILSAELKLKKKASQTALDLAVKRYKERFTNAKRAKRT